MSTLRELQDAFAASVLTGEAWRLSGAIAPMGLDPVRRVQIYRNHFTISLAEALAATYPVLCRLVGAECFDAVAARFAGEHPPVSPVVAEYGDGFGDYLAGLLGGDYAYLADVGAFEWAIARAYHAPDAPAMRADALLLVPEARRGDLLLHCHPSLRLLASVYPVLDIWAANQDGADPDAVIDLAAGPTGLMVWRHGMDVVWRSLDDARFAFIAALLAGRTLADAVAALAEADGAVHPGEALAELLSAGLVAGFSLQPALLSEGSTP